MRNKVVLITGGNSGIGRMIVHRFAQEHATVVFVGRDQQKGAVVLNELSENDIEATFLAVDLASEPAVAQLVDKISDRFGRLDVVVNNAGLGSRRCGITELDSPGVRWDKLRGPNLDSTYYVCAYTLPLLAKSDGAAVVNISSTATQHGNWGLYGVAKAAIEAVTRSFAVEGAPHRIRVNCVSPGWIATEQDDTVSATGRKNGTWEMAPSLLNRMGTPEEIASAVLFLASDEASFITGQTLVVDGGLTITDYPSMPLLSEIGDRLMSHPGRERR